MFYNPTNMDIDYKGRVWVAEGRAYRSYRNKIAQRFNKHGDRIMVLTDTDADGKADQSHVFVQDPQLISPLGVAVIGNKVVVSQPPSILVYHDVNHDAVFDSAVDKKEVLLTGFGGRNHDHSLHAVTAAPSGQWVFNTGNAGTHIVKDKDGWTLRVGSSYNSGSPSVTAKGPNQGGQSNLKSDDGHVYVGSALLRVNADGTGLRVVGHNMRNSYEEAVNSFGDYFQNDNDDPPACRVTWMMEHGNMGFSSDDGTNKWQLDRRPGQTISTAHWRQEDPGKIPAGDVYGNGSPTGICFYENGALASRWNGLLLSCEAARNVIFGYLPKAKGAGYELERFDFLKAVAPEKLAKGQVNPNNFRPSDVTVGPDGCIYVADWFDTGVGGHKTSDGSLSGTIYRIAPKGHQPVVPTFDLTTTEGQIHALKSPAVNVRNLGFTRLKAQGEAAVPALKALLNEESDYIKARAIWLLAQIADSGVKSVEYILYNSDNVSLRLTGFRALKFVEHNLLGMCKELAEDSSIAIRREIALALRDFSWLEAGDVLYTIATQYDGEDRWYLEAVGTGASGKESELYDKLVAEFDKSQPVEWSPAMARLAWRLHPEQSAQAFYERASNLEIPNSERIEMMTSLGYIPAKPAALFMVALAEKGPEDTRKLAKWWLSSLSTGKWADYKSQMKGLNKKEGALLPDKDYLVPIDNPPVTNPTVAEVLALQGDAEKGAMTISRCYMCHQIKGKGVEFGPNLTQWGIGRSVEAIARAIIHPSEGVAHGYDGTIYTMKKGHRIQGLALGSGDSPFMVMRVMGGGEVSLRTKDTTKTKKMTRSLMLSAGQLGLQSQDVADIVAYLRALGEGTKKKLVK